jgi:hypothetical protein
MAAATGEEAMPIDAGYVFIVSMDVQPDKEALFNEVYDTEHVPLLSKVPGVRSVSRFKTEVAKLNVGGNNPTVADGAGAPRYVAIYEIDSPDVMLTEAWQKAAEAGRWPTEVRPHTFNRHHIVRKKI